MKIGRAGGEEAEFESVYLRAVGLVMMLFFALLPTGHILLRSVIEERTNRVIEVLVSSVTPFELMLGKILGLGAVGLTLLASWAAAGVILSLSLGRALPVSAADIGMFVLYFVPGYFLFAALLGTIGSVVSSEREAQPFLTPLSLMLVFPVMMGIAIAQSPDHWLARALSFFPLLTPSLMLFRFAIKAPPAWEIAATWLVLVGSTIAMSWAAARIFRVGILLTGKRPTFPEIVRWAWSR
jgi:ABC-2 type transport system permease protein